MKKRNLLIIFLCGLFLFTQMDTLAKSGLNGSRILRKKNVRSELNYMPGRVVVKFKHTNKKAETTQALNSVTQSYPVRASERLFKNIKNKRIAERPDIGLDRIHVLTVPENTDIRQMVAALNQNPAVEYAEPDYIIQAEAIPNDTYYSQQQHLPQILAEEAWEVATGDSSVIVAIIDTGTDWDHPDLAANIWTNEDETENGVDSDNNGFVDDVRGWDFVNGASDVAAGEDGNIPDNNPMDFDGHGSHTSGIAAAVTDNNLGIASVSWNVEVMPLRIGWRTSDGNGVGLSTFMSEAFIYAADNGAHVASLSYGNSEVVVDGARYAYENGVVVVTSAGNGNDELADPLSLEPYAISVAAVDDLDRKASYSTYGDWVTVSAPGGDLTRGRPGILSTVFNNNYASYQGSSMSAPLVAGLAALVKSQHPEWTPADVMFQIVETADNLDGINPSYSGKLGSGRINALRAVTETVIALPKIKLQRQFIDDSGDGNGNGRMNYGETIDLSLLLENFWEDAENLSGTLTITDPDIAVTKETASFGTLQGIRDLSNNRVRNDADPFVLQIGEGILPKRVACQLELTANNGYSEIFEFYLAINPSVLLVDDDDGKNNIEGYYMQVLDSIGVAYDVYDHDQNGTPPFDLLYNYPTVIWACEWTFPSLNEDDRFVLGLFLDAGGKLFISGQDIGWDLSDIEGTMYVESGGSSRDFYQEYFHAQYILDASQYSRLIGIAGDPISDELSIDVFQPGRSAQNQYPSEVEPINGGISVFEYPNGNSGAVRYAGMYRTVYFAFGGFEAIVEEENRLAIMPRVLNWLNAVTIEHSPLPDTEDSTEIRIVTADVNSELSELTDVYLFWRIASEPGYNSVKMDNTVDDIYTATIPPQFGEIVEYFIFAQNESGYSTPIRTYTYSTQLDTVPPFIVPVNEIPNSIDNTGTYYLEVEVFDNIGVDTSAVFLNYRSVFGKSGQIKMQPPKIMAENRFEATIDESFAYGDTIYYSVTAEDMSLSSNSTTTDEEFFIIGLEDFETGIDNWLTGPDGWGIETSISYEGENCINDHPGLGRIYPNNSNVSIILKDGMDLTELENALLSFWTVYFLETDKDFGYVEINTDGSDNWVLLGEPVTGLSGGWKNLSYSLENFVGESFDNVRIRFRMTSDSTQARGLLGWYIDEIQLAPVSETVVETAQQEPTIPDEFQLMQNYPNPFNPTTRITFGIPVETEVRLEIYNNLGQRIRTLLHENKSPGRYTVYWDGRNELGKKVSSGLFFYTLRAGNVVKTRKMVLLK
ncbi:S8 family serine peptidase [candidate division KSB1 bacterium]|nr:S8 family serine peptidase [candidate division KSB1 bacterium]